METKFYIYLLIFLLLTPFPAFSQKPCGPAPEAERHRIKAGEGFPPLPLPVTPLRRTEKKRPPAPPTLMGKINYGDPMIGVRKDGSSYTYYNWTNVPGDTKGLFNVARGALGVDYKADVVRIDGFSFRPDEVPIMYFTGFEKISFTPEEREKIRQFVLQGGFIFGDSCCGTGPFDDSFREEMQTIFPERPWHKLPPEHPLFSCYAPVDEIVYFNDNQKATARMVLEGVNIGCRAAIIFSPYDITCGWAGEIYPEGRHVAVREARMMGLNLLSYCLAYYRLGRDMSISRVYREETLAPGEIAIGQIMHNGDWDPAPHAVPNLMRFVSENTTGNVAYKRKAINLQEENLSAFPFLYLTGHLDFHLEKKARDKLADYLKKGGFLLISNCCNRAAFDHAVRRELKGVFPEKELVPLPATHPVYQNPWQFGSASAADGEKVFRDLPNLYGMEIDGYTAVIYSIGSLGSSWDKSPRPYIDLLPSEEALSLGTNIVTYAITH
ncbi:DUF4159 domain-containing protein [Candidatus Sumerlaeota bacterium]|nr:DUF4159 domain-containing protein [Candidatus Sumerlaeota bacterium]